MAEKIVTLQLAARVDDTVDDASVAQQIGDAIDPDGWNWDISYPSVVSSVPARPRPDPAWDAGTGEDNWDEPDYSVTYGDEAKRDPCAVCGIRSTDGVNMAGDRLCAEDLAAIEDQGDDDVDWDDDAPQSAMLRYRDPARWAALHPGQN